MIKKIKYITIFVSVLIGLVWLFCLPKNLFDVSYSSILYDQNGDLLGAHIAADEQWRFPLSDSLPNKYVQALLCFEDKRFFGHPGVDPVALGRAIRSNFQAGRIVSGGSTITMQLMRMARGGKARTVKQKGIEIFQATRAELKYSKRELLQLYAAHAPFGGNVVGLEAASWRYFGKSPQLLTWAEAATLAVLPNSPALIHPGRKRDLLLQKRNRLLLNMAKEGHIKSEAAQLAMLEQLPKKPFALPQIAPHYLDYLSKKHTGKMNSNLDKELQLQINDLANYRSNLLSENEIHNIAALVIEVKTGRVVAYVGNAKDPQFKHSNSVDLVQAERSSGSILKPILYASAIQEGLLYPKMLLLDIPSNIHGYKPENFHREYDGVVPADEALYRSLNVPAVRLLQAYGIGKFKSKLEEAGIQTLHYSPEHYGLPLIIGGAEINLWEITHTYANMALTLGQAYENNHDQKMAGPWHYGALWSTMQALQAVKRPDENGQWESFEGAQNIAWKTGTSYGHKDAWAVGITPEYAVGVWVGNADGQGRPELVGSKAAAPVLFDLFRLLPNEAEFEPPYDALIEKVICLESGLPATELCPHRENQWVPNVHYKVGSCTYHKKFFLNKDLTYQVNRTCFANENIVDTSLFVLDVLPANFYSARNPYYQPLPPFHSSCTAKVVSTNNKSLAIIYPQNGAKIYIPIDFNGMSQSMICKVAKTYDVGSLYWYLDDQFLGLTEEFHTKSIQPTVGFHELVVKDKKGNETRTIFEILSK